MASEAHVNAVAVDLGASSGRVSVGRFDGERLAVAEIHRFPNSPVRLHDRLYWDFLSLYHEIGQGLSAAHRAAPEGIGRIGIDSWGLDFGLIDAAGELLGNPRHYRDARTRGMVEEVGRLIPLAELYQRTGVQLAPLNSLYQLLAMVQDDSPIVRSAETFLMIPDLVRFFLTGERSAEYTIATTTQCIAIETGDWDRALLDRLGIPIHLLPPIVRSPAAGGVLRQSVARELGLAAIPVVAVAGHDTASAVAAVPARGEFAYLSCGTWSLLGTEVERPILDERARRWNFTNEGGLHGTHRFLKNIMGLWLVERCRRDWTLGNTSFTYDEMMAEIEASEPFVALIDPDAPVFLDPPLMPNAIVDWCRGTGQTPPRVAGGVLRCIHESLALTYRLVLERLELLVGTRFAGLHLVGGGARNRLLCQFTANALGRPVWAGPIEATSIGNILAQLMAAGAIADLTEGRALVEQSFPVETYEPRDRATWDEAYARFATLRDGSATPEDEER